MMKFKHVKRGTEYEILDIINVEGKNWNDNDTVEIREASWCLTANFQFSGALTHPLITRRFQEGLIVIYCLLEGDAIYARPALEFFDGRFERVQL